MNDGNRTIACTSGATTHLTVFLDVVALTLQTHSPTGPQTHTLQSYRPTVTSVTFFRSLYFCTQLLNQEMVVLVVLVVG